MIGIFAILAVSLDLLVGQAGQLSLAQGAFFGIGAYVAAILAMDFGISFVAATMAAMAAGAVLSLAVSLPSVRLYGDYFTIATFGFQMIVFSVLNNWIEITAGPMGIRNIPVPSVFGVSIASQWSFAILTAVFVGLSYAVAFLVSSSPFGRVLRAIREDELFAQALGKDTTRFKIKTFALASSIAASAGSLYGSFVSFIDPTSFTVFESILVVSMVIIGGAGNPWGALLGAAILVTLPEALRFMGLPPVLSAHLRQIVYGALLIVLVFVRPQGLIGRYALR